MELPTFKAPKGFVNFFMMDNETAKKTFNVDEETAERILNTFCLSILQNSLAVEREKILQDTLSEGEYNRYLETGYFTYDGKEYNEDGEEI
ncbi:hypothetical protein H4F73_17195 [Enterobacter hormaechei]|uniref:hypothetical protein n=1 Tax=Enterobacter hormaechei TaxID=158836 RepID=UPI00197EAC78|nr:hypothetical protein [Enterobacter hormaechei]MBN4796789.1 hypothetical protein [Enterobacter hormaechei]MBN4820877.1 hypothetical protein [Enterobacter hormaechei]